MSRWSPVRPLPVLVLAGVTTLAGCGSSTSSGGSPTGTPTATTSTASSPASIATPTGSASAASPSGGTSSAAAVRLPVTIANGKVSPNDTTITVHRGQQVSVVVTSDTATEVHVHGYNLHIEAKPGTVTRTFTADQAGTFEIETHDPAFTVYELQVD